MKGIKNKDETYTCRRRFDGSAIKITSPPNIPSNDEIFADYLANEVLSNDDILNRLAKRKDKGALGTIIGKLFEWIRDAIDRFGMTELELEAKRVLRNMERMLSKALDAGRGGVSLETVEKNAREAERTKEQEKTAVKTTGKLATARASLGEIVGESGKNYGVGVYLDSELLSNLTDAERIQMVKEYVKELGGSVFTAYDNNQNAVSVHIAKANEKYINSNGKRRPVNNDLARKQIQNPIKQDSIALIDELIVSSKYDSSKASTHPHGWVDNNGKNDWEYWKTYLLDKENTIWEATLNIATTTNGEKLLYDIDPIKNVERSVESDTLSTDTNIAHQNQDVNSFSQNSSKKVEKFSTSRPSLPINVETDVKKHYGSTYRWSETGYILQDGTRLDLSGRNEGASGGYRTVDHRDIFATIEDSDVHGTDAMVEFMSRGNIRVMPETPGINLSVEPNAEQYRLIQDFVERVGWKEGYFSVDIDNALGETIETLTYEGRPSGRKVVADLKQYFKTGAAPYQSKLSAFRYSLDVNSPKAQREAKWTSLLSRYVHRLNLTEDEKAHIVEMYGDKIAKRIFSVWENTSSKGGVDIVTVHKELERDGFSTYSQYPTDFLGDMDSTLRNIALKTYQAAEKLHFGYIQQKIRHTIGVPYFFY